MALTAFSEATAVLTRERAGINLKAADVYIAKGDLTGESLPTTGEWATFLAKFATIGICAKESPKFNDEDVTEEVDYETDVIGVKCTGEIITLKISNALLTFIDTQLRNQTVTIMLVPKEAAVGDNVLIVNGVKLTKKTEFLANGANQSKVTFGYTREADSLTDVYKIHAIPAAA